MKLDRITVICVSHRGMSVEITRLLATLASAGARVQVDRGSVDLCYSRNRALNDALLRPELERVLLLDDDMIVTPQQALQLLQTIPDGYAGLSGLYVRGDGVECAWPLGTDGQGATRWHVGLGFCAVHAESLRRAKEYLPTYRMPNGPQTVYCQAGPHPTLGHWQIDDESFCRAMIPVGGIGLDRTLQVGHLKSTVLWPV